jgi:uncharacterized protein
MPFDIQAASPALSGLSDVLASIGSVAVAVSGGVDSLTLAAAASRTLGPAVEMFHAVSPAVPAEATERTRRLAAARGWRLHVFDAGEFADARYVANPQNRCFYCKFNLYGAISALTSLPVASGTNLDDLGDFRPGLDAARNYGVRHPLVEAGIDKCGVRALAVELHLGGIAELPAAPCLSSRVETGIPIQAQVLAMIERVEAFVRQMLSPRTVRCRVRAGGLVVELDTATIVGLDPITETSMRRRISELAALSGHAAPVSFAPYRAGSAFVRTSA